MSDNIIILDNATPENRLDTAHIEEVKSINDKCVDELTKELQEIKLEYGKVLVELNDIKARLESKEQQIENLMCSVQSYSASMHVAINRATSSIDTLNNNLVMGCLPKNGSSSNASKSMSVSSVVNSGPRVTKRAVSINVLFSYVFRLFEGDEVNEAPDLEAIIEKYNINNKVCMKDIMNINNLLTEEEFVKYNESLNKLKKETEKTPKKKASLVWAIAKNNKEFHKKFEAFKTHYSESSENKA